MQNAIRRMAALGAGALSLALALGAGGAARPAHAEAPAYNTPFLTDSELEDYAAMGVEDIRSVLAAYGSYFRGPVKDVDGVEFDPSVTIYRAAQRYRINPKVILTTLEKENEGITRTTRPSDRAMSFLTGCLDPSTAREQLTCTAERLRAYDTQLRTTGATVSGWQVGVPKRTLDGVVVTPANRAVAGQFTYTPYAGAQWGGDEPQWGGVYLFFKNAAKVKTDKAPDAHPPAAADAPATRESGSGDGRLTDPAYLRLLERKLG